MHKCSGISSIMLCTGLTMAGLTACDATNTTPIKVHHIETMILAPSEKDTPSGAPVTPIIPAHHAPI